jgi:hypothetical protein
MRLVSISWRTAPILIGLRVPPTLDVGKTSGPFAGWRVIVSGPTLMIVSPLGWDRDTPNERTVFETPRNEATLRWAFGADEEDGTVREWQQAEERPAGIDSPAAIEAKLASGALSRVPAETAALFDVGVQRPEPPDEPVVSARRKPERRV